MVETWELRTRFARALAASYGREVPAYATLVDVAGAVDADFAARYSADAELERISPAAADIGGRTSVRVLHLAPRVFDIDDLRRRSARRGLTMIDRTQGPPAWSGPDVLLRRAVPRRRRTTRSRRCGVLSGEEHVAEPIFYEDFLPAAVGAGPDRLPWLAETLGRPVHDPFTLDRQQQDRTRERTAS
ncbi:2-oxoadipate dioxygenase/decarboxylase family protein [Rhodococcus sp. NPDC127530]|uniref:2-oxoadipate dioxygenase/decarboxylase family protein n=1 Tax=unclassified Rhodococcus (in: high G+C Gram-positive bacteria) TaxID=192944 RepID=UPI00363AB790